MALGWRAGPPENGERSVGFTEDGAQPEVALIQGEQSDFPTEYNEYPFVTTENREECSVHLDNVEEPDGPADNRAEYDLPPENGEQSDFPTEYKEYPFVTAENREECSVHFDNVEEPDGPAENRDFPTEYKEYPFVTAENREECSVHLDNVEEPDGPSENRDYHLPPENGEQSDFRTDYKEYPFVTPDNGEECSVHLANVDGPAENTEDYDLPPENGEQSDFPAAYNRYSFMTTENREQYSVHLDNGAESDGSDEQGEDYDITPENGQSDGPAEYGDTDVHPENREKSCVLPDNGAESAEPPDDGQTSNVPAKNELKSSELSERLLNRIKRRNGRRVQLSKLRYDEARYRKKRAAKRAKRYVVDKICRALSKAADETEPEPGWAERQKEKIRAWRAEREAKQDWAERQLAFILEWRLMKSAYAFRHATRALKKAGLFHTLKPFTAAEKPGTGAYYKARKKEQEFLEAEKARIRKWAQEAWGQTVIKEQPAQQSKDIQPNLLQAAINQELAPSIEVTQTYDLAPSIELTQTYPMHMEPQAVIGEQPAEQSKDIQPNLLQAAINQDLAPSIKLVQTYPMHTGPQAPWHQAPLDVKGDLLLMSNKIQTNLSQAAIKHNQLSTYSMNMGPLAALHQVPLNLQPGFLKTPENLQPNFSQVAVMRSLAPSIKLTPTFPMFMGPRPALHQEPLNLKPALLKTPKNVQLNLSQVAVMCSLAPSIKQVPTFSIQAQGRTWTGKRSRWDLLAKP